MKALTKRQRERLLANGARRGADHAPAVKFFNPCGVATWLFNELDEDGVTLFGLADLGFGTPELGCSSLREIAARSGSGSDSASSATFTSGPTAARILAEAAAIA